MNVIKAKAYAPSHITGFFEIILDRVESAKRTGSRGCGFTLQAGTVTEVMIKDGRGVSVQLNDILARAPTTEFVVRELAVERSVEVRSKIDVPVGYGFGASGAGALSTALALNEALSLNLTYNQVAEIAHTSEVVNRTGLGDVIGQSYGGLVMRTGAGAPGIGAVDRIPIGNIEIDYVALDQISTEAVLQDEKVKKDINNAGRGALKELLKYPTFEKFVHLSKRFAIDTNLADDRIVDMIESVESVGGMAGMAMLGNTVFAVNGRDALKEFGKVHTSRICHHGAQLV